MIAKVAINFALITRSHTGGMSSPRKADADARTSSAQTIRWSAPFQKRTIIFMAIKHGGTRLTSQRPPLGTAHVTNGVNKKTSNIKHKPPL
jgi:hypothetical protein